jgi:hypothetical protein
MMLQRLIELETDINFLMGRKEIDPIISPDQWTTAKSITLVLEPFMLIQQYFEGEQYNTTQSD